MSISRFRILWFVLACGYLHSEWPKIHYEFILEPIDVVIPCAPKDRDTLELCIQGIRMNGQNIGRIMVVSSEKLTDSAEWIHESLYPFSKRDLMVEILQGNEFEADLFLKDPRNRAGWIFQQFLKLYAAFVIPEISSNLLVLDSDVIFLNPVLFMTKDGWPIFNTGSEYYIPYFNQAQRLLPELHRVHRQYSGICNYMLFQRPILEDLFALIRKQHGIEPWKALCHCINQQMLYLSTLSEYEIYFNFTLLRTNQRLIHPLKWIRKGSWYNKEDCRKEGFAYMSCDHWIRTGANTFVDMHPKFYIEEEINPESALIGLPQSKWPDWVYRGSK